MATNTNNLGLIKPEQKDFYNVEDFNGNFQKIDDFAGRKDNPHGVTAEQVGAALKGLIYGYAEIYTNEDLNTTLLDWFNTMGSNEIKNFIIYAKNTGLSIPGGVSVITINKPDLLYGVIESKVYSANVPGLYLCSIYNGKMTDWCEITPLNRQTDTYYRMVGEEREWVNPPMVPGVEYRTTERFNNKPVYVEVITVPAISAGSTTQLYGVASDVTSSISISGCFEGKKDGLNAAVSYPIYTHTYESYGLFSTGIHVYRQTISGAFYVEAITECYGGYIVHKYIKS